MNYKKVSFVCIIFAVIVSISAADDSPVRSDQKVGNNDSATDVTQDSKTDPTEIPSNSSTAVPSNSTTTTPPITTTAPNITTTSSPNITTTSSPNITTTSAPPTTTNKPQPPTTPTPDDVWTVTNRTTNETCILMKSRLDLHVTYIANATTKKTSTYEISVPPHVSVDGSCGNSSNSSQSLVLSWNQSNVKNTSKIEFVFNKGTEDNCEYFLSNITASVYVNVTKNNKTGEFELFNLTFFGKEFVGHDKISYTCANPSPLKLTGSDNSTGELYLKSLQYEAYHKDSSKQFSKAQDCVPGETPDIVPILVAAALILLVILVLAAYVITRRRSQARGYLSM